MTYVVTNEWNGGHNANMTVNAGQALNGWTVEFDSPAEIVNIWNAQITSHVGTHYVIGNMPHNAQVASGQSTTFGYQANGSSASGTPTNLKVNGQPSPIRLRHHRFRSPTRPSPKAIRVRVPPGLRLPSQRIGQPGHR